MSNIARLRFLIKTATYDVPDRDMYSTGSTRYKANERVDAAMSNEDLASVGAGLVAAKGVHRMARPFADTKIPLRNQHMRNIAALGAGLYAAKKTRDYFSRGSQNNGGV